jgi:hypothetical protein
LVKIQAMRTILFLALLLSGITASAQATFNSPESVEYDAQYHRWIVGNNGAGTVVSYYPQSNLTVPFASGLSTGPHGIEIMGNSVYVCDGNRIVGYDLATATQNFNLNLGATFLNGLTTDGTNYLFATDFSAKKIYRICPATNSYNIMASTVKTPNGIYYDGANNRCVFVTWGSNAPIQSMSLADSTISTLLTTTLSNCDGITRDNAGYWYVTSWGTNALNRVDPNFTSAPVAVMSSLSSPADIDINTAGDSIAIPNSGSASNVVFYTGITTSAGPSPGYFAQALAAMPNPAQGEAVVTTNRYYANGTAEVLDASGRLVRNESFYGNALRLDLSGLPAGTYFLRLSGIPGVEPALLKLLVE